MWVEHSVFALPRKGLPKWLLQHVDELATISAGSWIWLRQSHESVPINWNQHVITQNQQPRKWITYSSSAPGTSAAAYFRVPNSLYHSFSVATSPRPYLTPLRIHRRSFHPAHNRCPSQIATPIQHRHNPNAVVLFAKDWVYLRNSAFAIRRFPPHICKCWPVGQSLAVAMSHRGSIRAPMGAVIWMVLNFMMDEI